MKKNTVIGVSTKELIVKDGKPQIEQIITYIANDPMKSNVEKFSLKPSSSPIKFEGNTYNTTMPLEHFSYHESNDLFTLSWIDEKKIEKYKTASFNQTEDILTIWKSFGARGCLLSEEGGYYLSTLPYRNIINDKEVIERILLLYYLQYESKENHYNVMSSRTDVNLKPDFIFPENNDVFGVEITMLNLGFDKMQTNDLFNTKNMNADDVFRKNENHITLNGQDFLNKIQESINTKNKLYPRDEYKNIDLLIFMDFPLFKELTGEIEEDKKLNTMLFRKVILCYVDVETSEVCLFEISKIDSHKRFKMRDDFLLKFFAKPKIINNLLLKNNIVKPNSDNSLWIKFTKLNN